jgi:hypothetical protein
MKLILNDRELLDFLYDYYTTNMKSYEFPKIDFTLLNSYRIEMKDTAHKIRCEHNFYAESEYKKIKKKCFNYAEADLVNWLNTIREIIDKRKYAYRTFLKKNLHSVIDKIGKQRVYDIYRYHKKSNFVKTLGLKIDKKAEFIRRQEYNNLSEPCLIRNTNPSDNIILDKLSGNLPFYFLDSGYTNFIETNKKWHRIVINDLHYSKFFEAPSTRLDSFKMFPRPWRTGGHIILIIEPGPFQAKMFNVDIKKWKYDVVKEIRKYSDKQVYFRPKIDKKKRKPLFFQLMGDDYYCIININSNAAIEAIWAGVPAITLANHISNLVTVNKIEKINELAKPNLAPWLSMLSYSQFTKEEIYSGFALKVVKRYHV